MFLEALLVYSTTTPRTFGLAGILPPSDRLEMFHWTLGGSTRVQLQVTTQPVPMMTASGEGLLSLLTLTGGPEGRQPLGGYYTTKMQPHNPISLGLFRVSSRCGVRDRGSKSLPCRARARRERIRCWPAAVGFVMSASQAYLRELYALCQSKNVVLAWRVASTHWAQAADPQRVLTFCTSA